MSACVSPPQATSSYIVQTAPSIAQAASTAFPPRSNIFAPAVAPRGLPVMATQCRPCNTGRSARESRKRCAGLPGAAVKNAMQPSAKKMVLTKAPVNPKARLMPMILNKFPNPFSSRRRYFLRAWNMATPTQQSQVEQLDSFVIESIEDVFSTLLNWSVKPLAAQESREPAPFELLEVNGCI